MWYNVSSSRAWIPSTARHFMSRRLAVLLTPPRAIPNLPLFCTPAQKSETHPLIFQSLARSLQKRRRACPPTAGHQQRFPLSPLVYPEHRRATRHSPLSFHKSFRMNTYKSVSKQSTLTPFRINTYTKCGGRGTAQLLRISSNPAIKSALHHSRTPHAP
jgi:hypothetical protein